MMNSILPCVTLEDVPAELNLPTASELSTNPLQTTWFAAGTNGLVYQQVILDLPELSEREQSLLPLYTYCLTELGCGERDYRANQPIKAR